MGFITGFLVGVIATPLLLAIIAKPLMRWWAKKKLNGFLSAVKGDVDAKMNKFMPGVQYGSGL